MFAGRLDCRLTLERTFQGAVKCCICKGWEESRSLLCQKGIFCARLLREQASLCWEWAGNSLDRSEVEVHCIASVVEGTARSSAHFVVSVGGDPGSLAAFGFQLSRFQPRKKVNVFTFYSKATTTSCLVIPLVMQWAVGSFLIRCPGIFRIHQEVTLTGAVQPTHCLWAANPGEAILWLWIFLSGASDFCSWSLFHRQASKQGNCINFVFLLAWYSSSKVSGDQTCSPVKYE